MKGPHRFPTRLQYQAFGGYRLERRVIRMYRVPFLGTAQCQPHPLAGATGLILVVPGPEALTVWGPSLRQLPGR